MKKSERILAMTSKTATRARVRQRLRQLANITDDEMDMLMFEMGCQYCERLYIDDSSKAYHILTEYFSGFWCFWQDYWLSDDICLMDMETLSKDEYIRFKHELVQLGWADTLWYNFQKKRGLKHDINTK